MSRKRSSLVELWDSVQVELRGLYSTDRVLDLAKYIRKTSLIRAIAVVVGMTLPCLFVTLLVDFLPLSTPSEGISRNRLFLLREFYCFLVMTSLAIHQFRTGVRGVLPYPTNRLIRDTFIVSAATVGILYAFILAIGFPLPFTTLVVLPAWATLTLIALGVQWAKTIRSKPEAVQMLVDMVKLWLCDMLLAFVYPPYYYAFTKLSAKAQTPFMLLLPLIKLFMRNLFARAVGHLGDETPGLVVFNADVFGSLFVSYCMQSSPTIWTTLVLMAADICMMGLSLRDIEVARAGLGELEQKVDNASVWSSYHGAEGYISLGNRMPTTLERASILLDKESRAQVQHSGSSQLLELKRVISNTEVERHGPEITTLSEKRSPKVHAALMVRDLHKQFVSSPRIQPLVKEVNEGKRTGNRTLTFQDKLRYTRKVRQVLYMAEFLLLLNYVEVIIPLVFSIYLVSTYYMPNRIYYAVYDGMDEAQLFRTLNNVLIYCALQLVSLLILVFVLKRMIGLSPLQHIAFVLEKQVDHVQISMIFWLFYNVQSSLQHMGQLIFCGMNSGETSANIVSSLVDFRLRLQLSVFLAFLGNFNTKWKPNYLIKMNTEDVDAKMVEANEFMTFV